MLRPGGLPLIMFEQLSAIGFDHEAARSIERRPCRWARPPLLTDLELGGESLQPYLAVQTKRSLDELVDTYERFIAGYIYSRSEAKTAAVARGSRRGRNKRGLPSDRWFAKNLKLNHHVAKGLFVRPRPGAERLGLHQHLVQFAALVAYAHPVYFEHGEDTFVASTVREALKFGVRGGRLVSNFPRQRREIPVRFLSNPGGRLVDLPRGAVEQFEDSTLYDMTRLWLEANRKRLGAIAESLLLGVTILRWRSPYMPPGLLRLTVAYERSHRALVQACEEARNFEQFDDPLTTLRELFVPHLVAAGEFRSLFGNPYRRVAMPLPERTRQKWIQAINSLDPGYQGDQIEREGSAVSGETPQRTSRRAPAHSIGHDDGKGRGVGEESVYVR